VRLIKEKMLIGRTKLKELYPGVILMKLISVKNRRNDYTQQAMSGTNVEKIIVNRKKWNMEWIYVWSDRKGNRLFMIFEKKIRYYRGRIHLD
jgi:hypothetical protein